MTARGELTARGSSLSTDRKRALAAGFGEHLGTPVELDAFVNVVPVPVAVC